MIKLHDIASPSSKKVMPSMGERSVGARYGNLKLVPGLARGLRHGFL